MSEGRASGRMPVAAAPSGRPLLSLALASVIEELDAHSGAVYLLASDEPVLEMAVMAGLPRAFAAPWERVGLNARVPVADALRKRELVWVNGEEEMARRYPPIAMTLPYPFALAALPVATEQTAYGALFITWPGSHAPELSEHEQGRLTAACDRLALGLARAEEEGRRVAPEPDLLPAPATTAMTARTPGSVEAAHLVARLPYGLCALDLHGRICFANEATAELLGVPVHDLLGVQLWAAVPWLNDPVYEDRYRAALIGQHVTSFAALKPPGDWLSFRLYPGPDGLSVRISRARAVTEMGRIGWHSGDGGPSLVTLSQVVSLTSALTEAVGVQDVVQLVGDEIAPAVGSQALIMLGRQGGRLHVLGHRGHPDPRVVERFDGMPLTAPTPGAHALTSGVPAFFESRKELERLYPAQDGTSGSMGAWAYLPLIASGRPVGTCVFAYAEPHPFPTEERAVLTSLSGLIALALGRAQLYDTKERVAHGLQAALLPHTLPVLPGVEAAARYLPATQGMEIGGDFYDLVSSRQRTVAVIGDVQGHNVTAAGLMGQIRTAVRAYTTVGQAPGELMRSTNRLLIDFGSDLFASCLYLRLDPVGGSALMARAGHPPPLLRRSNGQVRVLDLAGGPLLGVDASAAYPQSEVALAPGSLLALYTDGLVESPGVDIEDAIADLGDRLAKSGDQPLDALADGLVRDSGAARERLDDVALLLLRVPKG